MKEPFFSVIIPAYNVDLYLRECLDNILTQEFKNFEVIIINDQSTDSTGQIIEEYRKRDSRIITVTTEKNTGNPFKARKYGIDRAIGRYIVPIDSDDIVDKDYLGNIYVECFSKNVDIVLTEMWKGKDDNYIKILPSYPIDVQQKYKGKNLIKHTLNGWNLSTNGMAVKKEIILHAYELYPADEIENFFADELLDRWALLLGESVCFSDSKYFYRIHSQSITNKNQVTTYLRQSRRNNVLLKFCENNFDKNSEEYKKALTQKTLHIIEGYYLFNNIKKDNERRELFSEFKKIKDSLDNELPLKEYLSLPYRIIIASPIKSGIHLAYLWKGLRKRFS